MMKPWLIWRVGLYELLGLSDTDVTFTVLAPTSYPAVLLGEFNLPEALVIELKSDRDCFQSLLAAMFLKEAALTRRLNAHSVDAGALLGRLIARARDLPEEEVEALLKLL